MESLSCFIIFLSFVLQKSCIRDRICELSQDGKSALNSAENIRLGYIYVFVDISVS
jgi:hypothetical protein